MEAIPASKKTAEKEGPEKKGMVGVRSEIWARQRRPTIREGKNLIQKGAVGVLATSQKKAILSRKGW